MVKEKNHNVVETPARHFKSMLENKDADIGYTLIWMRKALVFLLDKVIEMEDLMESDALAMEEMRRQSKELNENEER